MHIRFVTAALVTAHFAFKLYLSDLSDVFCYYTNWGYFGTFLTSFSLMYMYLAPNSDSYTDYWAASVFETVLPIELTLSLVFWIVLFNPDTANWQDIKYIQFKIIDHTFPLLALIFEWLLNNRLFNWPTSYWYCLYILLAYMPLSYFADNFIGSFPYFFSDFSNPKKYKWVAIMIGA